MQKVMWKWISTKAISSNNRNVPMCNLVAVHLSNLKALNENDESRNSQRVRTLCNDIRNQKEKCVQ